MKYLLTETIIIAAGTEFEISDELGGGGVECLVDRGCGRLFLGRAAALREGMLRARPALSLVGETRP